MPFPRFPSASIPSIRLGFPKLPLLGKAIAAWRLKQRFPLSVMRRHGFIVAKSGSGKSELLKLLLIAVKRRFAWPWSSPLHQNRSFLLLDPHGDVAEECARQRFFYHDFKQALRHGREPDLVFISPDLGHGSIPTLNPFDVKGKGYGSYQLEVMAQQLTGAFTAMLSKGDVRLSLQMKTLLTPMLLVLLIRSCTGDRASTFFDLERFLDDERNDDLVQAGTRLDHKGQRQFFERLFDDPKLRPTKFSLRVKLAALLNTSMFANLLARESSTWDLEAAVNAGKTIVISASKSKLGDEVSEIYGRTITALVQSYAFMRGGRQKRTPTYFVIDEAASFVSEDLKTILAQARKFGLHLVLVNQIAKQGGISQEFLDTIMGNTALKVVGNVGSTTRKLMARECETKEEHFKDLRVGCFVVKTDGYPPVRVSLPEYWLGMRNTMPPQHWKELKLWMLRRYYRPKTQANPELVEEIQADRIAVSQAKGPRHNNPRPNFNLSS